MLLRYLKDPANAITAVGLALSMLGIYLAAIHRPELAVAAAVWAFFLDHLDGVVAHHTCNRTRETAQIGGHLDTLTDLAGACILPAIILMDVNDYSIVSTTIAVALVIVGALRLAYYETFHSQGGYFIGVPVIYTAPAAAIVFLLVPIIGGTLLGPVLTAVFVLLIVLQLTTIKVPLPRGWMYGAVTLFTIASTALLIA